MTSTSREECAGSTIPALKLGGSLAPSSEPFWLARVPSARDEISCRHMFWHARWDPTIVMAVYNNNNILMVHYEDLPDGDRDVIGKAIEEFRTSVCCPTPKHVTIQLFRNIHYPEFCCMGRQMQMRLETGLSSRKL